MEIGKLRHPIKLQEGTPSRETDGGQALAFADADDVWAAIKPVAGDETLESAKVRADVTHFIKVRYSSAITPLKRFRWGTRIFNIVWVQEKDERTITMICQCIEEVA